MAKGKKTGGRNFRKGQSGNPDGRPPLPPEIRALRKSMGDDLIDHLAVALYLSPHQITEKLKSKQISAIEALTLRFVQKAIASGDLRYLVTLLDRFAPTEAIRGPKMPSQASMHLELATLVSNLEADSPAS